MKKIILFLTVFTLTTAFLFGCSKVEKENENDAINANQEGAQQLKELRQQGESQQEKEPQESNVFGKVADLVKDFGGKLQNVSLQAPEDEVKKSMEENYGEYVSKGLLTKWENDPLNAPGRMTSSPWPESIEIQIIKKISEDEYVVEGEINEITSVEKINGGAAAKRPIILKVKKNDSQWSIVDVTYRDYLENNSILYENTLYGFRFSLPESWKGYTIITDQWEGYSLQEEQKITESGPMISIRHSQWTSENPRQDIPIMIFTLAQWNALRQDDFHIGAAPIGPRELGRNSQYVFALPARYNFAFPAGYEEVEEIIGNNALHPITLSQD